MDTGHQNTSESDFAKAYLTLKVHLIKKNVDPLLLDIFSATFTEFDRSRPDISKPEATYLLRIVNELNTWVQEDSEDNGIEDLLNQLNFNARRYFLYQIKKIGNSLSSQDSTTLKLELLAFEYKKVNQIQLEPGIGFSTNYPTLKEIISNWIDEEIYFLERKRQLVKASPKVDLVS